MDMEMVGSEAIKILVFLRDSELKPDEKIAVLDSAAGIIRATLNAETLKIMYANVLNHK